MIKKLRWLLFPFSLLYGLAVVIRNWCYDRGIFKSTEFNTPVISVGNLDVGGAGKTPMTEYLIRLLKNDYPVATLSRGYGRGTRGFIMADAQSTARDIGDEPAQFHQKFPDITVAVCEKRLIGITKLQADNKVVLLDDAYQHRAVKPGLSILLFDYTRVDQPKWLLPAGNLREPFNGRKRADIIIVSKCPIGLTEKDRSHMIGVVKPSSLQIVFFTGIKYGCLEGIDGSATTKKVDRETTVFLLTGIANPQPLFAKLQTEVAVVVHHNYPDHHRFSLKNISKLAEDFNACRAAKKLVITTEKDAQRLNQQDYLALTKQLQILVMPITVQFLNNDQHRFNKIVTDYVREHQPHHPIH